MKSFKSQRASVWLTVVALILMCGVAVAPLLTGVMPETADGAIHLYRLPVLDHALDDGSLFPRFSPATVYGYGSPLFNFYSPISLYPMNFLHVFGVSYLNAWLIGMAGYVVIAAVGAYLLGRVWGGGAVGVITAAAYVYSPYFIYDFLWRGTTSETAALAILPYVLWAVKTQADHPSRRTFLAVIISLALFIPMHNITAVLGGALILLYTLFVVLTARNRLLAGARVFGALALGALITTFYWLPAIRETANIKIDAITDALPEIDITRNLVSIWSAFQPPYPADPSLQQSPFAVALGWPQMLFALIGLFSITRHPRRIRLLLVISVLGIAFLLFMLTPPSAVIWDTIPLIGYSQYPTRLLGAASLLLALIAGHGVNRLAAPAMRLNGKMLRIGAPVMLMILFALPLTTRTPLPEYNPQSVVDSIDFERETGFVATSSFGEYVPVWTETLPGESALRDLFVGNTFIPRLRPPQGVVMRNDFWRHTSGSFDVTANTETTLVMDWLYLPYFQATLDGEPLAVMPSADEGRVSISVPQGAHRIEVWLAPSRTQAIATVVSVMALMGTTGILVLWPLLRGKPAVTYFERFEGARDTRRALIAVALAGILALGLKYAYDTVPNPLRYERFTAGFVSGAETVTDANFGREITLIGYDSPSAPVSAAAAADFTLYWTPRITEIPRDYVTVFVLRTPDGIDVSRTNDDRPGGIETHHWRHGQYQRQQIGVGIPAGTPPGTYNVSVQLFDIETGTQLDIIDAADNPVGVEIPLGSVEVMRAADSAPLGDRANTPVLSSDGLTLYSYEGMPSTAVVGQSIRLTFLWGVDKSAPKPEYAILWRAEDGGRVLAETPITLDSTLPFEQWQVGDFWYTWQLVNVPPQLDGNIQVVAAVDGNTFFEQPITVEAPERVFEMPQDVVPRSVRWGNGITLAGIKVGDETITFYWTTDEPVTADLRRFAHILAENGEMMAVYDGIPADWSRPVTGWLEGEYITDSVPLSALSGQTLRMGFYDERTKERISVNSSDVFDWIVP